MFRYYSTLRPITPGAYPKPADNPAMLIHNFDKREYVGKIGREAWGYVEYNNPLTKEQIEAFDFVAESGGEDKETICKLLCKVLQKTRGAADYYGTISVKNKVLDDGWSEASLVYWVTGVSAGCEVNKSNQNKIYNGEFTIFADYTQNELKKAIKAGEFTLHKVGTDIRVLEDINTMVTTSDTQGDIFKDNQTVRVMDQIANDIAVLFNTKYLGVVPNDAAGRISLWSDIVKHHEQLQEIRAIENFSDSDVTVDQGNTKKSVVVTDLVTVVNAMSKLYMTVTVA